MEKGERKTERHKFKSSIAIVKVCSFYYLLFKIYSNIAFLISSSEKTSEFDLAPST